MVYAGEEMPMPPVAGVQDPEASVEAMVAALEKLRFECDPPSEFFGKELTECRKSGGINQYTRYESGGSVRLDYVAHSPRRIKHEEGMKFMLRVLGHYLEPDDLRKFQQWFEAQRACDNSPTSTQSCDEREPLAVAWGEIVLDEAGDSEYRLDLNP